LFPIGFNLYTQLKDLIGIEIDRHGHCSTQGIEESIMPMERSVNGGISNSVMAGLALQKQTNQASQALELRFFWEIKGNFRGHGKGRFFHA
jgi:hypothetical protein